MDNILGNVAPDELQEKEEVDISWKKAVVPSAESLESFERAVARRREKNRKKRERPIYRRILESGANEFKLLKFLLHFPFGVIFGFLFFKISVDRLDFSPEIAIKIAVAYVVIFSVCFALFVTFRCLAILILPHLFGEVGRFYIYTICVAVIITGPLANFMLNIGEVLRSVGCQFEVFVNLTISKIGIRVIPLLDAIIDIVSNQVDLQASARMLIDSLVPMEAETAVNDGELQELVRSVWEDETDMEEHVITQQIEERYKITGQESGLKQMQLKYSKKLELMCQKVMSGAVRCCAMAFGLAFRTCRSYLGNIPIVDQLCLVFKVTVFCRLFKNLPKYAGLDCNAVVFVNEKFSNAIKVIDDLSSTVMKSFEANMQFGGGDSDDGKDEENEKEEESEEQKEDKRKAKERADEKAKERKEQKGEEEKKSEWSQKKDTQKDSEGVGFVTKTVLWQFEAKKAVLNVVFQVLRRLLVLIFIFLVYRSQHYMQLYLTAIDFDNRYVTNYFRRIDERRRAQVKRTLLPLKKLELREVSYTCSCGMTDAEMAEMFRSFVRASVICLFVASLLVMDYLLAEIMDFVSGLARTDYIQHGRHHIGVNLTGNGLVAKMLRSVFRGFNTTFVIDNVVSNKDCMPKPNRTTYMDHLVIYLCMGGVCATAIFETQIMRTRRLVCDFFFPKRQKKRVLYLYNSMLRKRIGFLHEARHRVRQKLKKSTFNMPVSLLTSLRYMCPGRLEWLRHFGLGLQNCLICNEKETGFFIHCPIYQCKATYCRQCWIDVKGKCYACRDDDDWTLVSSGGGSGGKALDATKSPWKDPTAPAPESPT